LLTTLIQSDIESGKFGIQGKTSKKISRLIYWSIYIIEEMVSTNVVKLKLPTLMRIHPVVNISQVVRYRKLVER